MTLKTSLALAAISSFAVAGSAFAQTTPVPASGPAIPGVCTFSLGRAVLTSAAGLSMKTRLEQLTQQINAELSTDRTGLQTEQASIQAAAKTTPQEQLRPREEAFTQRYENFQRKVNVRNQEMQATQAKQTQRIEAALNPIVAALYTSRHCSILLSDEAIVGNLANTQMDITQDSITQLNGTMSSMTFDREHLDQQQAGASDAPVAAAPAAPAPRPATKKKK